MKQARGGGVGGRAVGERRGGEGAGFGMGNIYKKQVKSNGGGGGFFLAGKDFGRMIDNSFPACTFFS